MNGMDTETSDIWKIKCLDTLTVTLQKTINYLEDLGADVAAWVVLPATTDNCQIKHVGSKKGGEFILTKPSIDADIQYFLENYKKNEKDEIKKASKEVLVDMCIQLFDQKYAEALQKFHSKFPYSLLTLRGKPWFTLSGFPQDLLPFRHPSEYDVHSLQSIINCKDLVKFNILHKKLQDAYYNKEPCNNMTKSALQRRLSGGVRKSQDQMDQDLISVIEKDTATLNHQQGKKSKKKQRKEKTKCTNDLVVKRSKRRKTSKTKKYVSLLTTSCISNTTLKKIHQKDQKLKPKTQDLAVTNTNENTFIMQIKEEPADPDDNPIPAICREEDDSNISNHISVPLNVSGCRSSTKYVWESDNNHTKSDIIDSVEMTCEESYDNLPFCNYSQSGAFYFHSGLADTQNSENLRNNFSCSMDSNNAENIMIKIEPIEH